MSFQQSLQRNVFEKHDIGGFHSVKVDSMIVTAAVGQGQGQTQGLHQITVRTTDSLLLSLDCEHTSSTHL